MSQLSAIADDSALLHSYASQGDAGAFAELVRRYAGLVYATARRITGSADVAEDVAQDCFLRLAQKSAAITGSVAAWLHRTCVNRSLEMIRSERARKQREAAAPSMRGADAADDPAELITHVDQALASLPDDLRIVVTEHFLCGRTQVDLAAALNVNQATISRRIDQGISELRQRLRELGWTAAPLALPLLLRDVGASASAPSAVGAALTKIGLSGVGGASTTAAGAAAGGSIALKVAAVVAACVAMGAAGLTIKSYLVSAPPPQRSVPPSAALPATEAEVEVKWDQVPAAVRNTIIAQSGAAKFDTVDRETDGGKVNYAADATINGKSYEIKVAADGTLIWKKPNPE